MATTETGELNLRTLMHHTVAVAKTVGVLGSIRDHATLGIPSADRLWATPDRASEEPQISLD